MAHALFPTGKDHAIAICLSPFLSNAIFFFYMQTVGDAQNLKNNSGSTSPKNMGFRQL